MAKSLNGAAEIWLLPELRRDDLFVSDDKNNLALVNPVSLDDDSVSNLSRRMAHSFLHKDENFHSLLIRQNHASTLDLTQQKLQLARFHYLKQQQLIKHQFSAARRPHSIAKGSRPLGFFSSSASPPGSGMRAVFLNPRKESSGTGVFLPRQPGCPNEPRKKQACSTALLPARVVQVLNLNLDELGFYPRVPSHGELLEPVILLYFYFFIFGKLLVRWLIFSGIALAANQKKSSGNLSPPTAGAAARLPPEWTY